MIPKIIHQIWIGPKPLPDKFRDFIRTILQKHPQWEYFLWTEDNIKEFGNFRSHYHIDNCHPAIVADVLRVLILKKYGGVYLDVDCECLRPLDPLLECDFFAGIVAIRNQQVFINGAVCGSAREGRMINLLKDGLEQKRSSRSPLRYGIHLYTDVVLQHIDHTVLLLNKKAFHLKYGNPDCAPDDQTFIIHHFAQTWKKDLEEKRM